MIGADFQISLDSDDSIADGEYLHQMRSCGRTEVVTIDQRVLLAVGEALSSVTEASYA